jgi:hypothetical protein
MISRHWWAPASLALGASLLPGPARAQGAAAPPSVVAGIPVNYDEAKVGSYILPDPLVTTNGERVRSAEGWMTKRRPELVRLFEEYEYGKTPGRPAGMTFDVFDEGTPALGGTAIRRQVTIHLTGDAAGPKMDLLLYLPAQARGPVPVLLNLSFTANSSVVDDPGIRPGEVWGRDHTRVPAPQGRGFGRIDVAPILASGIGFATVYYGDIEPDFIGGIEKGGIRRAYLKPGQTEPAADEWGAISAWAWGLSRALDYLETDPGVDAKRVAITGASRLGKTVLWAGAHDPRFAMVIASVSGEGGAALSRRNFGETVAHLTAPTRYPYQFAGNYATYADRVNELPVDGHLLISLIAPRPLLLQTGSTDLWSDPKGEFLAAVAAGPVYRLLGAEDLGTDRMPAPGQPILHTLGYLMHEGGHGTLPQDWPVFLEFMKRYLLPAGR